MKGKFWRKALAASLALLIVTGSVPIKPISNVFESMVVTAEAVEEYTKTFDFSTGQKSTDYTTLSLIDPADNVSKTVITLTDSINSSIIWQTNPNFAPGFISNSTGVEGTDNSVGVDTTFIISPNVDGKVTKIEFSNVARNLSYSEEEATFVSDFSLKISGMKYNGTYDVLTGIDGENDKRSFTFISTDEGGISGNLSLILGPNSLFRFQKGSKMIITYVPDEAPAHEHSFSFNATGNTLTATCSANDGCPLADSDHKATLTLNAKDGYYGDHVFHGANHNCSSFNAMTGLNATVDDIVYTNKSTGETSTSLVSAVGSYTATLVVHINGTDYTLTKDFVVRSNCEINNVYPQINISTADMPEAKYAREGEKVTLSFTSMYGESLTELTVTGVDSNNGISLTDEGNGIYSFIMPSEGVNIGATFSTISVSYLDENGETQTCNSATLLSKNETTLSEGWYVVPYNITYRNELALSGDVHLILANGTEMYIANWNNGKGITADQGSIAIYGQAKVDGVDTGKLTINGKDTAVDLTSGTYAQYGGEVKMFSNSVCIHTVDGDVVISGGKIDLFPDASCAGIDSEKGDIKINGGNVRAEKYGLLSEQGTITLGWTNETDSIYSERYSEKVIIVNDKVLKDDNNTPYFGTISTPSELKYKTLSPYNVHIIAISDGITGGTVSADKVANKDDIVTLTVTPNAGYVLKSLTVKDSSNTPITVTNNQFTMPDSNVTVTAEFEALSASAVIITTQPTNLDLEKGASSENILTVKAEEISGHTLSYQWYKNTTNSTEGGSAISGATGASYAVPTDSEGTDYYYCVVTATRTDNNKTATATSNIAVVTVADYSAVTWKNGDTLLETDAHVRNGTTPSYDSATPTKTADAQYTYTFSGWSDGTKTYAPDALPAVSGDVTYTAQFSETVNEYTVTWIDGNGNTLKTEQVAYGTVPSYSGATPTKTATAQFSYTFTGWDTTPSAVTSNATYTAQFSETLNKYTVKWVDGDGKTLKTETLDYGATPTEYNGEIPTKTPTAQYTYTFKGWDKEISQITGDTTYTAQFDRTVNKYTVTWKNENGTALETDENVEYGTMPEYNGATPTKASTSSYTYSFAGWSPAVSSVKGDVTYTATFTAHSTYVPPTYYTITYKVDGEVYQTASSTSGSKITLIDEPTKEGYTFSGWQTSYTTMPAQNIEITGTFAINQYAVTYKVDGVQYGESLTVDHGTKLTAPTAPTKNGAIFLGWTADGVNAYDFETPVTAETTLTAMWLDASGFITFSEGYAVTDNTYNDTDRDYVGFRFDVNMDNSNYTVLQHGILYGMNVAAFGEGKADANLRFTDEKATALMDKVREFATKNTDTETTDWIEVYIGDRREGVVYARGFIIVTDGKNKYLIYSDVKDGSYNSFSK